MKKTLVAAAALAFVGVASAQSSVTLYGRIDASIGSVKTSNAGFVAGATTDVGIQIRSGAHTGSRWGLRGSEDLGGGLKANFVLEQGFSIDNGEQSAGTFGGAPAVGAGLPVPAIAAVPDREFHRQAFVGLSGGFGTITIGRQYDPIDNAYGSHDAMGYSGFSAINTAFNSNCAAPGLVGSGDCIARQNNSVQYAIPTMSGLNALVMWAPGENKAGAVGAGRMFGTFVNYANGPLQIGGAYQTNKATSVALATNVWEVGGSYNLGVANVFLQFVGGNNKTTTIKDNGWNLGLSAPMGPVTISASYARENQKLAGARLGTDDAFSALVRYDLSKRTYVYGAFHSGERDPAAAGIASIKIRQYGAGLVHNF